MSYAWARSRHFQSLAILPMNPAMFLLSFAFFSGSASRIFRCVLSSDLVGPMSR